MRSAGILSDLVRLSIRKFVVDFSTYRALRWLQAGRPVKAGNGRRFIVFERLLNRRKRLSHCDQRSTVGAEFLVHSNEEQDHADQLAARIVQLGGEPDFSPDSLSERSHAEYVPAKTLTGMIRENLVAERIAIDSYRDMVRYLGDQDPTTSDLLKQILAVEEQHADELADLLEGLPVSEG